MSRLTAELRGRCKVFASRVIRLYIALPKEREEVRVLGKQLLRSGTSVDAHAREASRARSDAEFCSKLDGLLQEADESQLWLELLREDCGITDPAIPTLHKESDELLAIFTTMVAKMRRNGDGKQRLKTEKLKSKSEISAFQLFKISTFPSPRFPSQSSWGNSA